jgi:hypothetical protein
MAGLFDMFSGTPQSQGLLAAAAQILQASGPSRTPTSLGQILGSGLGAYQQQEQQARQTGQAEKLRGLQIQGVESDLAQQQSQIEKQARTAQAAQAAQGPDGFDQNTFVNNVAQFDPMGAMELRKSFAKAAPKFDSGITFVNGPDGKPVAVRTADDGSVKQVEGYAPREKLEFRDTGNAVLGVNPYTGERQAALAKGVSPDASLSAATQRRGQDITMRGQNMVDARAVSSMPTNKPIPTAALKMQQSELDALSTASAIDGQLGRIQSQLDSGKLSFGPVSNLINQARNAAGMSSEESRNQSSFRSNLEKLRNDSLRLNAGVQTDGDAQRAWNELFTNLNDTDLVKQRLGEIRGINTRAAQIRKLNVDGIRANYGRDPLDTSQYEQPGAAPAQQPAQAPRAAAPAVAGNKTVSLADITATARASGRSTKEVTAALRAKGYTIGGQ